MARFYYLIFLLFFGCSESAPELIESSTYMEPEVENANDKLQFINRTTFINGDEIQQAKTNKEWVRAANERMPAWCYSDNDKKVKLYNYYAFSDGRGLVENNSVYNHDSLTSYLTTLKLKVKNYTETVERNFKGNFYDFNILSCWLVGQHIDTSKAIITTWDPVLNIVDTHPVDKGNGFAVIEIKRI